MFMLRKHHVPMIHDDSTSEDVAKNSCIFGGYHFKNGVTIVSDVFL